MKNNFLAMGAIMTSTLMLVACGGGDDSKPSSPVLTAPANGSVLRVIQIGDKLNYKVSGFFEDSGDVFVVEDSSKQTLTALEVISNNAGSDCIKINNSGTLNITGTDASGNPITFSVPVDTNILTAQSDAGLFDCGDWDDDNNQPIFLTNTDGLFLDFKSPLQVGDITSGIASYADGSFEDCTRTVLSFEKLKVPAGEFDVYKTQNNCVDENGEMSERLDWISPSHYNVRTEVNSEGKQFIRELESFSFQQ